uniref:Uncharacterized protein n=1 Tax=Rhizophora mucronata TaxID=61149 RepID=A0A2P2QK73_RHIMU
MNFFSFNHLVCVVYEENLKRPLKLIEGCLRKNAKKENKKKKKCVSIR